jgi:hypothetical protein
MSESMATTSFGGLTILTGIGGTFVGGLVLDRMRKAAGSETADPELATKINVECGCRLMFYCGLASFPAILLVRPHEIVVWIIGLTPLLPESFHRSKALLFFFVFGF